MYGQKCTGSLGLDLFASGRGFGVPAQRLSGRFDAAIPQSDRPSWILCPRPLASTGAATVEVSRLVTVWDARGHRLPSTKRTGFQDFSFFSLAQRAWAARRLAAFNSSLLMLAIRAFPPFRPSSTAAAFLRVI
jgi:hypothetical protein